MDSLTGKSASQYLESAKRLADAQKLVEACELLRSGEKEYPSNPDLFVFHSYLLDRTGTKSDSLDRWKKVIERFPDLPDGYIHSIRVLTNVSRFDEARNLTQIAIRKFPNNSSLVFQCAYSAFAMNDLSLAEERWLWALDLAPNNPEAMTQLRRVRDARRVATTAATTNRVGSWEVENRSVSEALSSSKICIVPISLGKYVFRDKPASITGPFDSGLGADIATRVQVYLDPQRILFLPKAKIFAQRMVEADGAIFCDYPLSSSIMDEYIAGKRDVGVEESGFRKCEGGYKTFDLNQDVVESSTNLVIATSSEPLNYGAWLIRVLPKIMYARDVMGYSGYRFLVYADRDWQKGLLAFLGVPEKDYVPQRSNATYTAPMVILPSWPNTAGFLDERTIAMTVQLRTMAMARQPNFVSPKAIYVSRRLFDEKQKNATKVRPFAQELELESALANFGIVPFYPETVSFAETILTFANADLIVGRQGAAMSNCIFCRPGTQVVDIEHLSTFLKGHCNMFASCGLNYSLIIGRAYVGSDTHSVHKALEIDMPSTVEVIRGLLQS